MRLIDADRLLEEVEAFYDADVEHTPEEYFILCDRFAELINASPTAYDIRSDENRKRKEAERSKKISFYKTRKEISNLARVNVWQWSVTFTFEMDGAESSDYETVVRKVIDFLCNQRKSRCPDMKYLIIPELSIDGRYYHFHGLFSGIDGFYFSYSGRPGKSGRPVFRILNWNYGPSSATQIDVTQNDIRNFLDHVACYIVKDNYLILKHKKCYLCSRNIERMKAN